MGDIIWSILGRALDYVRKRELSTPESEADAFIKLAHSDEIKRWKQIPSYEHLDTLTLADYHLRRNELRAFSGEIPELIKAHNKKRDLDVPTLVTYDTFTLTIPPDIFKRHQKRQLKVPIHRGTRVDCTDGIIDGNQLIVKRDWRKKSVQINYSCPSSEAHYDEIQRLERELTNASESDKWKLNECINSMFNQPVLFISHRWEGKEHPDPDGRQLEKLSRLKNCFVIYDYFSFPQDTHNEAGRRKLTQVLKDMTSILCNVVVLRADNYIERGWCLYEYILASLKEELVCDEIGADEFVELRDIVGTRVPPSSNIRGDSLEASLDNSKSEKIISTINAILPKFEVSGFTVPSDRSIVKELLVDGLLGVLPAKQVYTPYIGWQRSRWSREEIEGAFTAPMKYSSSYSTKKLKPKRFPVYGDVDSAVQGNYIIETQPPPKNLEELMIRSWDLVDWGATAEDERDKRDS